MYPMASNLIISDENLERISYMDAGTFNKVTQCLDLRGYFQKNYGKIKANANANLWI